MKIRMLVGLAGSEYSIGPGDEREFPDKEAIRLIDAGYAVPVAEKAAERAVAEPALERRGKKGKADVVSNSGNDSGDK
jgi:hypothetical protein